MSLTCRRSILRSLAKSRTSWSLRLGMLVIAIVGLDVNGAFGQTLSEESLKEFRWRNIGPTATGGRVVDIDVDPRDFSTIYVASASGGLFKTTNAGTTWNVVFDQEGTVSIGDIAVDPQQPDTIWLGTGEANNQRSSYWGDGIYKSTDGGESWKNMGLPDSHHIGRIIVDPNDSNVVYVAAAGHLYTPNEERGLFKTTDGGQSWSKVLYINPDVGVIDVAIDPQRSSIVYAAAYERRRRAWDFDGNGPGSAIYRSMDGGETWTKLTEGLPSGDIGRIGIEVYPKDPRIVYATVSNQNTEMTSAAEVSAVVTADGNVKLPFGFEVTFGDNGCEIVSVDNGNAAARQGFRAGMKLVSIGGRAVTNQEQLISQIESLTKGDQVEVVAQRGEQEVSYRYTVPQDSRGREVGGQIYRSDDSGQTWKLMNERPVGGSPAYYYGQIRIDPTDDQRLYVLGVPVYVSSDGGKNWSADGARSVHVDHHALWIDPTNPKHLMLGNDGGFHVSWDQGQTWDHVFNLPIAQFYAIGVDMQYPYHVYGGLQDNGSWGGPSAPRGGSVGRFDWYRVGGGDGFYVQVDPNDSDTVIGESQFGAIYRLDKRTGRTASIRPPASDPDGERDRYNWNSPILMSQHDPRLVYFGGNKLFKSYNLGDDWIVISPDLTTADAARIQGNVPHCTITTIAESRFDRNVLLVGTDDGKVQWTNDGGESWTDMSNRFPFQPRDWWCSRVELSRHDRNTAYVTFTGYREDDFRPFVFATRDGGETWQSISNNLPEGPVNVIKEDLGRANVLYVGTEFGVFVSINRGETWQPLDQGLPRIAVHDLLIHPRDKDLVAGTHARGIYIMDDITPFEEITPEMLKSKVYLFKVRPEIRYTTRGGGAGISGDRHWEADNPPSGVQISYYLESAVGESKISLEVYTETNERVAELEPTSHAGINRVAWEYSGRGGFRGRGGRGGRGGTNRVITPGTYWAVLTVDGEVYETKVEIKADPNE